MKKQEYKYEDWSYSLENENLNVSSPISKPKKLYKYYSNTKDNRDALMNNYLFCSHPFHLNDSMDSSPLLWDFSNLNENTYNNFFIENKFAQIMSFDKDKADGFQQIIFLLFQQISNLSGVISLSSEPLHTLMWSHYASEKGFMIDLDTDVLINNSRNENQFLNNYVLMPVKYVEELESIDCFSNNFTSMDIPFLYSVGIKKNAWIYENEWRLLPFANNFGVPNSILRPLPDIKGKYDRKIYYSRDTIRSIILGKHFFNGNNLQDIDENGNYILKENDELNFINFLIDNFNDRLFQCAEFENGTKFKRNAVKINMKRLGKNIIKIKHEKKVRNNRC